MGLRGSLQFARYTLGLRILREAKNLRQCTDSRKPSSSIAFLQDASAHPATPPISPSSSLQRQPPLPILTPSARPGKQHSPAPWRLSWEADAEALYAAAGCGAFRRADPARARRDGRVALEAI